MPISAVAVVAKLPPVLHNIEEFREPGQPVQYLFWCPACKSHMWFRTEAPAKPDRSGVWTWNRDLDKPTVLPSILVFPKDSQARCHLFITDGVIEFLSDCAHEFAGKSIPMEPAHFFTAVEI